MSQYRWTICALLFFATTINYLDRAVISLVKEYLDAEFKWTKTDYANVTVAFQLSYALAMVFVGRVIDWLGTKMGYAISLVSWSFAAMAHYFVPWNLKDEITVQAAYIREWGGKFIIPVPKATVLP